MLNQEMKELIDYLHKGTSAVQYLQGYVRLGIWQEKFDIWHTLRHTFFEERHSPVL